MQTKRQTEQAANENSPAGIALDDIYFVLFRHKMKIAAFALAGVLGAVVIYLVKPPPFQSEAKLFIPYVMEGKPLTPTGSEDKLKLSNDQGDSVLNSEIEILTSLDLMGKVVDTVGAEKILAKSGGGKDRDKAAALVRRSLKIEVPKKTEVIQITFSSPDVDVVRPVLTAVLDAYKAQHVMVHQTSGPMDESLSRQADELRASLKQTENQMRDQRLASGIVSLEDSRRDNTEEVRSVKMDLIKAQSDLAEQQGALSMLTNAAASAATEVASTNASASTNVEKEIPRKITEQYKRLNDRLDDLWKVSSTLINNYTETSKYVTENREQIAAAEKQRDKLEADYPGLLNTKPATPQYSGAPVRGGGIDRLLQAERIRGLQSRVEFLNTRLAQLNSVATNIDFMGSTLEDLELKRRVTETNYIFYATTLAQRRSSDSIGANKISNISTIQLPSPPFRDSSKTNKFMALSVAAGVFFGLAFAFVTEFFLDRSVKRNKDIETKLGLSLFLSIPDMNTRKYKRAARLIAKNTLLLTNGTAENKATENEIDPSANGHAVNGATNGSTNGAEANGKDSSKIEPWDHSHSLHPFYESLRNRLVGYFEIRNLNHKPKLVAVAGCGENAGTTTIASGLAASLSETGDGNVLLVDMNLEHGAAQHFFKGKPRCDLDDALKNETREGALVQDNLYIVSGGTNGDKLPRILPKRFANLLPQLKASDYDYIIFDMPPVSKTSVTLRLSGFMDMVLLAVEAEKTNQEAVKRANALLAETNANVSVVLNKTRTYIPAKLHQELL